MVGEHERLPDFALLNFTVAYHGVHAVALAAELAGHGDPVGGGDALAERAGRHIHAGGQFHIRMPLQDGAGLAQGFHFRLREEALNGQRGVQNRRGVSLGQHEPVPVGVVWIFRIDAHLLLVEVCDDIRG